jgi:hypothetical protein
LPILPSVRSIPQRPVIDVSATSEHPSQFSFLSGCRVESEPVTNFHTQNLLL